jgi:hypothetical protein
VSDAEANAPGRPVAPELPSGSPVETIDDALGVLPAHLQLPLPRWLAPLAVSCALGIVPWIVYLALTLPDKQRADDYALAWVGFDSALALVLAGLAYCAIKRKPATELLAGVAATMLAEAVLLAVFAELPLAIICAWTAVNAERLRASAYRRLRLRWERAVEIAHRDPQQPPPVSG